MPFYGFVSSNDDFHYLMITYAWMRYINTNPLPKGTENFKVVVVVKNVLY